MILRDNKPFIYNVSVTKCYCVYVYAKRVCIISACSCQFLLLLNVSQIRGLLNQLSALETLVSVDMMLRPSQLYNIPKVHWYCVLRTLQPMSLKN
jgi:hypothetical protein